MYAFIVFAVTIMFSATTVTHDAQPGRGKAFMDEECIPNESHSLPEILQPVILIDSSGNAYSAWTQAQECLSFNPAIGGLQFVCRGYGITGILNVHQTNNTGSFWVHDYAAYNQELGAARYPNSSATDGPHLSFPTLIDGAWGGMTGEYEEGGWWSSFWAPPVNGFDMNIHKVIAKQMDDGNIVFVGYSDVDEIFYRTMSPDLMTTIAAGTISTGYYYWGFDYNGGIGYMFYYDDALNVYYRSTTDGVTWSPQTTYNLVWPQPYTSNLLFWTQLAVTDAGNPILVFDFLDNDDYSTGTYPYLATTFISRAEGQPCISASSPYTRAWYPTIATGGNIVVVLVHVARANSGIDSLAFQDIVAASSFDGGATFSVHQNLTSSLTNRPGLAQLAKRLDVSTLQFFYFYGINAVVNHDPIYHAWRDPEGLDPHYWYVYNPEDAVREDQNYNVITSDAMLTAYPNPFSTKTAINYALSSKHYKDKDKPTINIYDACGRKVKCFLLPTAYSLLPTTVQWDGVDDLGHILPPGVYFVKLLGENLSAVDKVIKLR